MKKFIRWWLGITEIQADQCHLSRQMVTLDLTFDKLRSEVRVTLQGIGRIIAKIDSAYPKDELSPERKADSDKIAEEVLKRLFAEQAARDKHP